MKAREFITEAVEDRTSYQVAKILADKGIKYDSSLESKLISAIGAVMVKELGMNPTTVRNIISYDDDFLADTLSELQHMNQGVTEGSRNAYLKHNNLVDIEKPLAGLKSEFEKFLQTHDPEEKQKYQQGIKKRIKSEPMSGPKGVLPEQGEGNFAGDAPVNIGGATVKRLGVGDAVTYFGQPAKILAQSTDRKHSRITITKGMGGVTQNVLTSDLKRVGQGVAEGSLNEGQYEMMMRNGQVKKFIAKDDADAKRIAAGHGAKSVIKLRGGVPAGKIAEQGVAEGYDPVESDYQQWEDILVKDGYRMADPSGAYALKLVVGHQGSDSDWVSAIRNILAYVKQNRAVLGKAVADRTTVKDAIIDIKNKFPQQYQAAQQQQGVAEGKPEVDSLVTDTSNIMQGPEFSDAELAIKTVLGDRAFNERRSYYSFFINQLVDMYGKPEGSKTVDSLVTNALGVMRGPTRNDAIAALKTALGNEEYKSRSTFYKLWVNQAVDKYSKKGVTESSVTKKPQPYNEPNWAKNLPKDKLDAIAGPRYKKDKKQKS